MPAQQLNFPRLVSRGLITLGSHMTSACIILVHRVNTMPCSPREHIVWLEGKYVDEYHISMLPSRYLLVTFVLALSEIVWPSLDIVIAYADYLLLIDFGTNFVRNSVPYSYCHLVSVSGQYDTYIKETIYLRLHFKKQKAVFQCLIWFATQNWPSKVHGKVYGVTDIIIQNWKTNLQNSWSIRT